MMSLQLDYYKVYQGRVIILILNFCRGEKSLAPKKFGSGPKGHSRDNIMDITLDYLKNERGSQQNPFSLMQPTLRLPMMNFEYFAPQI